MANRRLVELPAAIGLTLREAGGVLVVLDSAKDWTLAGSDERASVDAARRLVERRLWPGLGDLVGEEDAP